MHRVFITTFLATLLTASFVLLTAMAPPANAATLEVPSGFATLQAALNAVQDGDVIELADGTYSSPAGGFLIGNKGKSYTIRAATGATATLDGGGTRQILRFQNVSVATGGSVVFEGLTFANGFSQSEGLAGGVTIYQGRATFVDCHFRDNSAMVNTTVGGGVYVADHSEVYFFNCLWTDNISRLGGAGLGIRGDSTVFIHGSQFLRNRTNPPNHALSAGGGGINAGNSVLRVANTLFQDNESGAFGAGLYAIGNWLEPFTVPRMDVIVSNSTFIDNRAQRDGSVSASFPTEGGGINVEDQTWLRVYHSRFLTNSAMIGGGVNNYRARVEIRDSLFQGNQAVDTNPGSGFGGAISNTSNDVPGDPNRPNAEVTVERSFIQGRFGGVTTAAQTGACFFVAGDSLRIDGNSNVPDQGTVAENRAQAVIRDTVFYDCDVFAPTPPFSGNGGAIGMSVADLTLEDSLILDSDALGGSGGGSGGGLSALFHSVARVNRTTFAGNTAEKFGGAIFTQGAELLMSDSELYGNQVAGGFSEDVFSSFGAALFTSVDDSRNLPATGLVENSIFSANEGLPVFDDDRMAGPINGVLYNGNTLFSSGYGGDVFRNSLGGPLNASELNGLVVTRNGGVGNTDKSPSNNNSTPGNEPVLGEILAAPPAILQEHAAGDAPAPGTSWLAYAWAGGGATLDGGSVSGGTGTTLAGSGIHTLSVDGDTVTRTATLSTAALPAASLTATPLNPLAGASFDLAWNKNAGTFLGLGIDQGITAAQTASGTTSLTFQFPLSYSLCMMAAEGGAVDMAAVGFGPTDLIFEDGFENGSTSEWSASNP